MHLDHRLDDRQADSEPSAPMVLIVVEADEALEDTGVARRVEADARVQLQRERVAFDPLVADAIESVTPSMEAKNKELIVRYSPGSLLVDGDPARLTQVISNILLIFRFAKATDALVPRAARWACKTAMGITRRRPSATPAA